MKTRQIGLFSLGLLLVGASLGTRPVSAADGLAWDSVTKFSMNGAPAQVGTFDADFQAASQSKTDEPSAHHGMLGLGAAMSAMKNVHAMMTNGTAQHEAVAGSLRRTDDINAQTATIVDCVARTRTILNLANKTYRVESLDATPAPSHGGSGPSHPSSQATYKPDNTRMSVKVTTTALGPLDVEHVPTNGYRSDFQTTVIQDDGTQHSFDMLMTTYLASFPEPMASCPEARFGMMPQNPMQGGGGMNMGAMQQILGAMRTPNGDPRFTFSSSGPSLPANKFSLYSAMTQGQQQQHGSSGGGFTVVTERGNVHPVSASDQSVFGIPPGFTKEP